MAITHNQRQGYTDIPEIKKVVVYSCEVDFQLDTTKKVAIRMQHLDMPTPRPYPEHLWMTLPPNCSYNSG